MDELWTDLDRSRAEFDQFQPTHPGIAQNRSPNRPTVAWNRPHVAQNRPNSDNFGPESTNIGPKSARLDQICPDIIQFQARIGQMWSKFDHIREMLARHRPNLARIRPTRRLNFDHLGSALIIPPVIDRTHHPMFTPPTSTPPEWWSGRSTKCRPHPHPERWPSVGLHTDTLYRGRFAMFNSPAPRPRETVEPRRTPRYASPPLVTRLNHRSPSGGRQCAGRDKALYGSRYTGRSGPARAVRDAIYNELARRAEKSSWTPQRPEERKK